jgi:putative ABC transport system permease protein
VGLEAGIAISIDSLYDDFIESHRGENYTDITIHPKQNTTFNEMRELAEEVAEIKGVEAVSPVATFILIENVTGLESIPNNVILYGVDTENHPDFPNLEIKEGNKTLERAEVIVSQTLISYMSLPVGIRYTMPEIKKYGFLGTTVKVVGYIPDKTFFGNYVGFLFILIDLDYLVTLFSSESYLNFHLAVKVADFVKINEIAERIDTAIGFSYHVFREKSISDMDIVAIRSYQAAMNLIIIGSFVVEFLFLTNILTINIRERSKEFGVLRATGASTFQMVLMLGVEIFIYSGIASLLGNLLGIGISYVLVGLLNLNYPKLGVEALIIRNSSLFSTFVTGILIAWISGLYPIFKAVTLPVVQNIHWKMRGKKTTSRNWVYLMILGTISSIIGISTTYFIGPSRFLAFELVSWHFFVVWTIFLGTLLFESGLLHFLPKLAAKFMIWHKIVPRVIATRNVSREFQKSIITIMVTALALSFILIIGIISAAIIRTVPGYYNEKFGRIDIIAEASDDAQYPLSFVNDLVADNEEIERASFLQQQRTQIEDIEGYVFGIDPEAYRYFFEETIVLPAEPDVPSLLNVSERGIIISDLLLKRIGARIGDNLEIQTSLNSSNYFLINGITSGNPFLQHGNYLYCSNDLFQNYWENSSASWFIMSVVEDSEPLNVITDHLSYKYEDLVQVIAIDFYSRVIERSLIVQTAFFQILFLNTFLLSGLAQFICILISTLNMEREMGIMRAMGLTKREVFSTFFAESTLLGITGVVAGIINGLIGSELLAWYISSSIPIETSISPSLIVFWVTVSLLITIFSTIVPSYRSSRKSVAHSINNYVPRQGKTNPYAWENWDRFIDEQLAKREVIVSPFLLEMESEKVEEIQIVEERIKIDIKRIIMIFSFLIACPIIGGVTFFLIGFPSAFGILAGIAGSVIGLYLYLEKKPEKVIM